MFCAFEQFSVHFIIGGRLRIFVDADIGIEVVPRIHTIPNPIAVRKANGVP